MGKTELSENSSPTQQIRHARYIESGMLYHVVSKTLRGEFLLAPAPGVRKLCAGVVAHSQIRYPQVKLYAIAVLSNHFHMMVSGPSKHVSAFTGYIKQEISRRLGQRYKLRGTFWDGRFSAVALPTPESRRDSLRYILSQGVKEDLVESPREWPGLHCASQLMYGTKITGEWFNGTRYSNAKHSASRDSRGVKVRISDYYEIVSIRLVPIPEWEHLKPKLMQAKVRKMVNQITAEHRTRRRAKGKRVIGAKALQKTSIREAKSPPSLPRWEERRRQLTAWAGRAATATKAYLVRYWEFQRAFRKASVACLRGDRNVTFPENSWIPVTHLAAPPT